MNTINLEFERGKYGPKAVATGRWSSGETRFALRKGIVELELNSAKGWSGEDLSFLRDLSQIKAIKILDMRIPSVSGIHFLHDLVSLDVITYCKTEIDFSSFPLLERCGLEWRPKATSVFECFSLRKLFINGYKGKDTESFGKLHRLESLSILNAPTESLIGLTPLSRLIHLRLGLLRRLISLEGIEILGNIEYLIIQSCRGIGSIEQVSALHQLKVLLIENCAEIKSIAPIRNLNNLHELYFPGNTNIVDGDMGPLAQLTNMCSLSFKNRRHYTQKREEFCAYTNPCPPLLPQTGY